MGGVAGVGWRRRRPEAAAAGGDGMRRRRRVVCFVWVGSASTSEEGRRLQASANLFIFLLLPESAVLTLLWVFVAGVKKKEHAMAWKHQAKELEGNAALQLLSVGRPREVVTLKEYCTDMPVLTHLPIPGALPQLKDGTMVVEEKTFLAEPAQEVCRATLIFLEDLFKSGYCLTTIEETTLMVDTSSVTVLLTVEARENDVVLISSLADVDNTIASLAKKLEDYLFNQNGLSAADVPEVSTLFSMMAHSGNTMWYAIVNNSALIPLENRREFFIRMYEQLTIVKEANRTAFDDIMEELIFPMSWHDLVCRKLNGILFNLYGGAIYNATAATKKEQADQITRMFRNSGVHVLDRLGSFIGRSDVTVIHYAVAPLLYSSLQTALQKKGWLASTNVHTLFVYRHRRR